jgi:RNA polymerase sigma-70 factor (ECF subfamily)
MLRALADLAVAEREAVLLVAWDGLSNREAAAVFGCSAHAFEVRLSRARARLARSMAVNDEPQPARLGDAVRRRTWSTDGRASS